MFNSNIIPQLGDSSKYLGLASPTTVPGTLEQKAHYFAIEEGIYSNFSGYAHSGQELIQFSNETGSWVASSMGISISNNENAKTLSNLAKGDYVFKGFAGLNSSIPSERKRSNTYLATATGTVFGNLVSKGQFLYDTGTAFVVKNQLENTEEILAFENIFEDATRRNLLANNNFSDVG